MTRMAARDLVITEPLEGLSNEDLRRHKRRLQGIAKRRLAIAEEARYELHTANHQVNRIEQELFARKQRR